MITRMLHSVSMSMVIVNVPNEIQQSTLLAWLHQCMQLMTTNKTMLIIASVDLFNDQHNDISMSVQEHTKQKKRVITGETP